MSNINSRKIWAIESFILHELVLLMLIGWFSKEKSAERWNQIATCHLPRRLKWNGRSCIDIILPACVLPQLTYIYAYIPAPLHLFSGPLKKRISQWKESFSHSTLKFVKGWSWVMSLYMFSHTILQPFTETSSRKLHLWEGAKVKSTSTFSLSPNSTLPSVYFPIESALH